jgi:flavin-binding protein dodecin
MATQTDHAPAPSVVNIVEMVGESRESWEDAARLLVGRASREHRNVTGLDLIRSTAVVRDGRITEYHVTANLAFVDGPTIVVD